MQHYRAVTQENIDVKIRFREREQTIRDLYHKEDKMAETATKGERECVHGDTHRN